MRRRYDHEPGMTPLELGSFWGAYAGCGPVWLVPLLPAALAGKVGAAAGLAALAIAAVGSLLWALLLSAPVLWAVRRWARRTGREPDRAGGVAFAVGFLTGAATAAAPTGCVVVLARLV